MPSFGIMTAQSQVAYEDLLRVWQEADAIEAIDHVWLYDHLLPIFGPMDGPNMEAWTLLSALAARTARVRVGVCVTSNRFRPPALLAKIAATVDVVSGGRLDFGIGAGSRPGHPIARREYEAHGLPFHDQAHAVAALDESLTAIRRLWTEDEPFDLDGEHVRLTGAIGNPKPVQAAPPILVGGRTKALLRVAARHADVWNVPGGDLPDAIERSALLDGFCAEIGRDPRSITRSMHVGVAYDDPARARDAIAAAAAAGFDHFILGLPPAPYPDRVAAWVAEEIIRPA